MINENISSENQNKKQVKTPHRTSNCFHVAHLHIKMVLWERQISSMSDNVPWLQIILFAYSKINLQKVWKNHHNQINVSLAVRKTLKALLTKHRIVLRNEQVKFHS